MSNLFEFEFYTEDFDQEMLDFIEVKYGNSDRMFDHEEWKSEHDRLYYGIGVECFWTDCEDCNLTDFESLTKQEFKQLIGMDSTPEQSYIEELEDRINILEDLCSDYSAEIERLRKQIPANFKPINEMTRDDWIEAKENGWVFIDQDGDELTVLGVKDYEVEIHPYTFPFKFDGTHTMFNYRVLGRIK